MQTVIPNLLPLSASAAAAAALAETSKQIESTVSCLSSIPSAHRLANMALTPSRRLRPQLMAALVFSLADPERILRNKTLIARLAKASAAVELLHRASLLIDDLIDLDESRRGEPAFYKQHGKSSAILIAHLLASQAGALANECSPEIGKRFMETYKLMSLGQGVDCGVLSTESSSALDSYLTFAVMKTSVLYGFVFEIAWIIACDANGNLKARARALGESFGTFYQMGNDLHDDTSDPNERGNHKRERLVALSLGVAIAIDQLHGRAAQHLRESVGKVIPNDRYAKLLKPTRSSRVKKAKELMLLSQRQTLLDLCSSFKCPNLNNMLDRMTKFLVSHDCWDHQRNDLAGY